AILAGVTHIDAEHVGAGREQPRDHRGVGGGRSKRGDDFGAAQSSHFQSLIFCRLRPALSSAQGWAAAAWPTARAKAEAVLAFARRCRSVAPSRSAARRY